jgi:hypothetical protein
LDDDEDGHGESLAILALVRERLSSVPGARGIAVLQAFPHDHEIQIELLCTRDQVLCSAWSSLGGGSQPTDWNCSASSLQADIETLVREGDRATIRLDPTARTRQFLLYVATAHGAAFSWRPTPQLDVAPVTALDRLFSCAWGRSSSEGVRARS